MEPGHRKLPIDMTELCIALESEAADFDWYLDTETGDTLLVNGEYEPDENGGLEVSQITGNPQRFRKVPRPDQSQGIADMQRFADEHPDPRLKESLMLALEAPRPERRFRAVLGWLPDEQQRWHVFRQQQLRSRAVAWLAGLGLQPG